MDYHLVSKNIGYAIEQNSDTDIKPKIATRHDSEHHIQPTWDGKDQSKKIIFLKETIMRTVMIFMKIPRKSVHHIFMRKPRHKFHGPEGCENPKYVDEDAQALNSKSQNSEQR